MSSPRYPEHTPDPERIDPRWAASALGALAFVLMLAWVIFYPVLPRWVALLLPLAAVVAVIESYRSARRAGEQR